MHRGWSNLFVGRAVICLAILISGFFEGQVTSVQAAPSATVLTNTLLDSRGIYFISYDGLVNVNSFQISTLVTHKEYQYVAWYSSNRNAMVARRKVDATNATGEWAMLQLSHRLAEDDSHNVISLGVSPQDGK
jgi:hypothetical protein